MSFKMLDDEKMRKIISAILIIDDDDYEGLDVFGDELLNLYDELNETERNEVFYKVRKLALECEDEETSEICEFVLTKLK